MRFLKIIYFSQYYELKNSGRDPQKGRLNGTLLSAVIIMLNIISMIILLFKLAPNSHLVTWLQSFTTGHEDDGKIMGKFYGAIFLVMIGGLLRYTIGTKNSYNKIADEYLLLPDEVQKKTLKQSLYIFLISFGLTLLLIFMC